MHPRPFASHDFRALWRDFNIHEKEFERKEETTLANFVTLLNF